MFFVPLVMSSSTRSNVNANSIIKEWTYNYKLRIKTIKTSWSYNLGCIYPFILKNTTLLNVIWYMYFQPHS